jgi:hypothetical protein
MIGGVLFSRVLRAAGTYHGMAGDVVVERSLYREVGKRNAKVVDPVSLRAGVVADGWLPQTARAMSHEVQKATSREAEASARETGRLPYSRSSFERVTHAVGALYLPAHFAVEDAFIEAYEVPAEARSISVSLDRVRRSATVRQRCGTCWMRRSLVLRAATDLDRLLRKPRGARSQRGAGRA